MILVESYGRRGGARANATHVVAVVLVVLVVARRTPRRAMCRLPPPPRSPARGDDAAPPRAERLADMANTQTTTMSDRSISETRPRRNDDAHCPSPPKPRQRSRNDERIYDGPPQMDLGYYDDLVIPIDQVRSAAEAD